MTRSAPSVAPRWHDIAAAAARHGLTPRGGFHPAPDDAVPAVDGRPAATLVPVGNVGGAMWPVFAAAPEACDGRPDPLDRWSRRVIDALAAEFGARAHYPFDGPPFHPFQRWARRAEGLEPSPLFVLIHPVHGLWHAYRGALVFDVRLALPPVPIAAHACDTCAGQPCLSACPVGAYSATGFDVGACAAHLRTDAGRECRHNGCLDRRACPVAPARAYPPAQQAFHMAAFLRARGG